MSKYSPFILVLFFFSIQEYSLAQINVNIIIFSLKVLNIREIKIPFEEYI